MEQLVKWRFGFASIGKGHCCRHVGRSRPPSLRRHSGPGRLGGSVGKNLASCSSPLNKGPCHATLPANETAHAVKLFQPHKMSSNAQKNDIVRRLPICFSMVNSTVVVGETPAEARSPGTQAEPEARAAGHHTGSRVASRHAAGPREGDPGANRACQQTGLAAGTSSLEQGVCLLIQHE